MLLFHFLLLFYVKVILWLEGKKSHLICLKGIIFLKKNVIIFYSQKLMKREKILLIQIVNFHRISQSCLRSFFNGTELIFSVTPSIENLQRLHPWTQ